MIRKATMNDINECVQLAKDIYEPFLRSYGIPTKDDDLTNTVRFFIHTEQNLVIERNKEVVGMVAWTISGHPANSECVVMQEVLWCCNSPLPTDALLLLRAFDKKAKELNADVTIVANLSLANETQIRRIYDKIGYKYLESHYSRGQK